MFGKIFQIVWYFLYFSCFLNQTFFKCTNSCLIFTTGKARMLFVLCTSVLQIKSCLEISKSHVKWNQNRIWNSKERSTKYSPNHIQTWYSSDCFPEERLIVIWSSRLYMARGTTVSHNRPKFISKSENSQILHVYLRVLIWQVCLDNIQISWT